MSSPTRLGDKTKYGKWAGKTSISSTNSTNTYRYPKDSFNIHRFALWTY
mgnify:CR=1 FL=1|jgi:hypothetical protein